MPSRNMFLEKGRKKLQILIPAIAISRGCRTIEIPKEVVEKWLSMQKSQSRKEGQTSGESI